MGGKGEVCRCSRHLTMVGVELGVSAASLAAGGHCPELGAEEEASDAPEPRYPGGEAMEVCASPLFVRFEIRRWLEGCEGVLAWGRVVELRWYWRACY